MQPQDCIASKTILSMRSVMGIYKKYLRKHQVTQSQLGIMMVLAHFRKLPQADLGRMMKLDRSTVTRDLKRLLEKKYLTRDGPSNKLTIEITESGLGFMESIIPDWEKAKAETTAVLGSDGLAALDLVVQKLRSVE